MNKPAGSTSRRVVDQVVNLVRPEKAGHAGTLDPLATGVLVVCVGKATRLIEMVQQQTKSYRAQFLLGRHSDTDDVTGNVTEIAAASEVTHDRVVAALPAFCGRIQQIPSDLFRRSCRREPRLRPGSQGPRGRAVSP